MRAFLPLAAVAVFLLTGCSSSPTVTDGGRRLIIATGTPGIMAGTGFGGVIGVDDAGCIVLGKDWVLLAPPGSTVNNDKITLTYGGKQKVTLTIGRNNQLNGGEVGPGSEYVPVGTKCSSTNFILLG